MKRSNDLPEIDPVHRVHVARGDSAQHGSCNTVLTLNSAKCLVCGDILVSRYRHDFVSCRCGNLAVDGGLDYERRVVQDPGRVVELSTRTLDVADSDEAFARWFAKHHGTALGESRKMYFERRAAYRAGREDLIAELTDPGDDEGAQHDERKDR